MDTLLKFITPGTIFLLALATGIWLSRSGKPLNAAIFNVHKLIALAVVIVTTIQVSRLLGGSDIQVLPILSLSATGLCFVALFATGALMSLGKLNYKVMQTIHKITPVLVIIAMAATIYLLIPANN